MYKTAEQMIKEQNRQAENLPVETKKKFWELMHNGHNLGEAAKLVGIDDMIAAALTIQLHDCYHVPKKVEDIK